MSSRGVGWVVGGVDGGGSKAGRGQWLVVWFVRQGARSERRDTRHQTGPNKGSGEYDFRAHGSIASGWKGRGCGGRRKSQNKGRVLRKRRASRVGSVTFE